LYLKMPSALLDGPYVVWVDGEKLADFEHEKQNDMNNLTIPLEEKNKVITLVGTKVVPEFGVLSMVILAVAVISVIAM
ncbi:MAG: PEFG-CTERM sorting domain-containing protein, partial [Aliifodinibius sp.]|nr:PEFG-CTERM sorting domain-containing protein [candidate division KSB1 bacterium]NIT58812.1 PEFG-CTERM sorting domain-containing protein [Fodinibius sp.]NIY27395.1 PEFG-CTERM sorting domain-containing protein [Fodinibius sp.]